MNIRKALAWSMAERYLVTAFNFISVIVLSRLMKPAEVGIFSVAYSVVAMSQAIRDFGTTDYLVQEPELTRDRIRTAFGLTMAMGFLMGSIVLLIAEPAARLYRAPDLAGMLRILSLTFFLWPFGAPLTALLKREMRFDIHARINVLSGLAQPIVSVALVWWGYTYWGLAWGVIAGVVSSVFLSLLYRARDTAMVPSFKEWRRVLGFGSRALATSILGAISAYASDLVIGRMVGLAGAGLYSRAASLSRILFSQVWGGVGLVALPEFARRVREGENVNRAFLHTIGLVTAVGWPILAVLVVSAHPAMLLLFGKQWEACAPVTQLLAIGGFFETVGLPGNGAMIATGNISSVMKQNLIVQPLRLLGFVIGGYFGLISVAVVQVIMSFVALVIVVAQWRNSMGVGARALLAALRSSATVTVITLLPVCFVEYLLLSEHLSAVVVMTGVTVAAAVGWITAIFILHHPLRLEIQRLGGLLSRASPAP